MDEAPPRAVPRGRLIAYYALLALAVGAVAVIVLAVVPKPKAQPSIAGGYDLVPPHGCLGEQINLSQSGQFVDLEAVQGSAGGNLRFKDGRLTGSVSCQNGASGQLDAHAASGRWPARSPARRWRGRTSASRPRPARPSRARPATCLRLHDLARARPAWAAPHAGRGSGRYTVKAKDAKRGTLATRTANWPGASSAWQRLGASGGTAADRTLTLAIGPADQVTATSTREAANAVAAFFIAVAVVMLVARLFGGLAVRIGQPRVMGEVVAGIVLGPDAARRDLARASRRRSSRPTSSRSSASPPTSG